MPIHCVSYYEGRDGQELVDIDYQCSRACMMSTIERETGLTGLADAGTVNLSSEDGGSISWGAHPCGEETNHAVYCSTCEERLWDGLQEEYVSSCPACGQPIDYCQGHGEIGDPEGARILAAHDDGDHSDCHPDGCDEAGS